MKLYKLTDKNGYTRAGYYNACLWGEGISHSGIGKGSLCSEAYIHAYTHPLLAILLNPIHGVYVNPRMWEAEGEIAKSEFCLKVGCVTLTTVKEIPAPIFTPLQRVHFSVLCGKLVSENKKILRWADNWLNNHDRSLRSAKEMHMYAIHNYIDYAIGSRICESVYYATKHAFEHLYIQMNYDDQTLRLSNNTYLFATGSRTCESIFYSRKLDEKRIEYLINGIIAAAETAYKMED